jgi:hypothetical protein
MTAIQEIIIKVTSNIAEAYSRATDIQRQQVAVKNWHNANWSDE